MARHAFHDDEIKLCNDGFEFVNHYKYLGHIIERNLLDTLAVEHRLNKFYSQFIYVFRNFKNFSHDTLLYFFNSFRLPTYGLEMCDSSTLISKQIFKTFEVPYNNALKRICAAPLSPPAAI